ncbi:MAG TPA: PAS domain S-box protein [Polyangiaceae bacterium]|nr:PAS domain S-box protein [Polyangiaceae bacterium]
MERTPAVSGCADALGLLEGVLENAPVAVQVRAADGPSVLVNRRFRDLFGSGPAVECGPPRGDRGELSRSDLGELVRRALRGETLEVAPRWYRAPALHPGNATRKDRVWAGLTLFPLRDGDGRVGHVALCFQDMTEQLERETALEALVRESEARAAILDAALDCIITMDATGCITHFNAAAEQTFGYSRSEAVGRPLAELVIPSRLRAAHHAGLARYLATGEGPILRRRIELTAMRKGGDEFPAELIVVPMASGGPPAFTGFVRDVTERKEVERALVRSEARFRRLCDAGFLGIITADIQGSIIEANDAFLHMVGRTSDELHSGKLRWSDITPPEWRPSDERAIAQLSLAGVAVPWEKEYVRKDESRLPVLVGAAMLDETKGECIAFILDLSDRREAERALERMREEREANLEESIRARDDFLAVAGHELRTPLAALLMQLQSLQRSTRAQLPPKIGDRLDKVVGAACRLRRLVDQLLDVSRITAGGLRLEPERVDLSEVLGEVVARTTESGVGPGGPMIVRGEPHVTGQWDRERIEQVVENLVENAVKYGQGKPVEIDLRVDGGEVVLQVADQGVGIDEDHQKRIFERFERAVSTRDFGGLGLGLWIARRVVEASGGRIAVRSAPGRGATFTVRLPIRQEETEARDART